MPRSDCARPLPSAVLVLTTFFAATAIAESRAPYVPDAGRCTRVRLTGALDAVAWERSGRIERLAAPALAAGTTPEASAATFVRNRATALGSRATDLRPGALHLPEGVHSTPAGWDRGAGRYTFEVVYYEQHRDGVPVEGARLVVLVRNAPGHPVVFVRSDLRDLGPFRPLPALVARTLAPAAHRAVAATFGAGASLTDERAIIWAGLEGESVEPRVARSAIVARGAEKWRVAIDVESGEVLHAEPLTCTGGVNGTVSGLTTSGIGAEQCEAELAEPLPWLALGTGVFSTFTDESGAFSLPATTDPIEAGLTGMWFDVMNAAGPNTVLSAPPSALVEMLFNAANDNELVRAQVNAYREANRVRDFAIHHHPDYPTLDIPGFPITVNRDDGFCPGNAWYDSADQTMHFCRAGDIYPNTAWSAVAHHEFGHHLVWAAGSGQGMYGEGLGDCMALLILDSPYLGWGFYGDCTSGLRNADNAFTYPCTGGAHFCGQLLSGSIWSTRNELILTHPLDYREILGRLVIDSILLHSGASIDPGITLDFLVLDDDDGNLDNGTPHSAEILAGFGAHDMLPLPAPQNDDCIDAIDMCPGIALGALVGATNDGSATCGTSVFAPDAWYRYVPEVDGPVVVDTCSGSDFDTVLSVHAAGCPGTGSTQIACNDDGACGNLKSVVTFSAVAGNAYLFRVSGFAGATGNFGLTVTGPPCVGIPQPLDISWPGGAPSSVPPGSIAEVIVRIDDGTESYVPGSGRLYARATGGSFVASPLTALGGGLYAGTLPAFACANEPEYYVTASGDGGSTVTDPAGAPADVLTVAVGVLTTALADDAETNPGWQIETIGASSGAWQRGVPIDDPAWDYDPAIDGDGSGQCWLTQNTAGNTDVDGGSVRLVSPVLDLSGGAASVHYRYFLRLTNTTSNDGLIVEVSATGPSGPWATVAVHTTDGGLLWRSHEIGPEAFAAAGVVPGASTVLRFTATDGDPQSVVEAGLDDVLVETLACSPPEACTADVDGSGNVGFGDLVEVLLRWGDCPAEGDCPADLNANGEVSFGDVILILTLWGPCGT